MTTTPNLGLTKDDDTDLYSVDRVNANSDKIDMFAGWAAAALDNIVGSSYGAGTVLSPTAESPMDLDDMTALGKYQCEQPAASYVSNLPTATAGLGFALYVSENGSASSRRQTLYINDPGHAGSVYERYRYTVDEWTPWYKFTGEAVT